jgi:hypothetical protein
MTTGFERDISCGTARLVARCLDSMNLGVRFAGSFVPAIADD